jgi:drug/metabolite transporter (DMT)-like permease
MTGKGGKDYATGVALVVLAGLLWSGMGLFIRQIDTAGTWAVLFWRSAGMVPVLVLLIAWRSGGRPLAAIGRAGPAGVLGGLALIAAFAGSIFAFQTTTVANAAFLFAASPVFAALFGWLILSERVRPGTWIAMAVAACGILVMVRDGLAAGALAGNLAALLSAAGFAGFTIALRWGRIEDMLPAVALGGLFALLLAAGMARAEGGSLWVPRPDILWSLAMGAVLLAGGMVLYTAGSRAVPAAELTLFSMVEVLLAPVWVWLLMGETASPGTFLGGALLLAAIAGNALSGARRGAVTG